MTASESRRSDGPATRRAILGGVGLASAIAANGVRAAPPMAVQPSGADTAERTSLHQEIAIDAAPARIYQALLSAKQFTAFTGMLARINPKPGGAASLFGGLVVARNVELAPDKRIVQAWRPVEDFPAGVYSLVKFELTPKGKGALLVLDHTGFPPGHYDHLYSGWGERYWTPLKKFLA